MPVSGYIPEYKLESPYKKTPILGNFMAYYVPRTIEPHEDDEIIVLDISKYDARPDLLAYDIYGNADLWWVFGIRNEWEDPAFDIKEGMEIIVPPLEYIRSIL